MTRPAPIRSIAVLGAVLALGTARAADPVNPHGDPDQCSACHLPAKAGEAVGAARSSAASCYNCHPDEDHHPVENTPVDVHPPADWPLEDGKLSCSTCHAEPSHKGLADLPAPWYRGGPYAEVRLFCDNCHTRSDVSRADPHHPSAPYAAGDPTCGACHSGIPARGATPEDAQLRLGPESTCTTCHPSAPHWGMTLHVGKAVPEAVRAGLPPEMPLLGGSVVQCWTCHDVHAGQPSGDVDRGRLVAALHARALAEDWSDVPSDAVFPGANMAHPPMLALPLQGSALCAACHGVGP